MYKNQTQNDSVRNFTNGMNKIDFFGKTIVGSLFWILFSWKMWFLAISNRSVEFKKKNHDFLLFQSNFYSIYYLKQQQHQQLTCNLTQMHGVNYDCACFDGEMFNIYVYECMRAYTMEKENVWDTADEMNGVAWCTSTSTSSSVHVTKLVCLPHIW